MCGRFDLWTSTVLILIHPSLVAQLKNSAIIPSARSNDLIAAHCFHVGASLGATQCDCHTLHTSGKELPWLPVAKRAERISEGSALTFWAC